MTQRELLLRIMQLVVKSGVCPDTKVTEWPRLILFAHTSGFLYMTKDLKTVVCAYRSNSNEHSNEMPIKEDGKHLHIAWAASESADKTSLLKLMRLYLKENKVDDITYYRRNSDKDFKKLNVKGIHE